MAAMTAAAANVTPTISKITSTGSATYSAGDTITFRVEFGDSVKSVTGGTPYLVLSNIQGATDQRATYTRLYSVTAARQGIEFEYTVSAGVSSSGIGIDSFAVNGATIRYGDDNDTLVGANLPANANNMPPGNGETIAIERFTPKIVSLETYDPSESAKTFTEGEEIIIKATLNGAIDADTFQTAATLPYLTLGVQNPGTAAGDKRAYLYSDMDEGGYGNNDAGVSYLIFIYTVKSGDYSGGLNAKTFAKSGATIKLNGTDLTSTMPADATVSNVKIDALAFTASDYSISGKAGETATLTLYRGEATSQQQKFSISNSTPGAVTWTPTAPAIQKNKDSVELTLTFVEDGDYTLFIHPDGYDTDAGDIEISLTIAEADRPSVLFYSGDDTLFEGNDYTFGITLSEKPAENVTITVESNLPDCLSITGGNTLTFYANQPPDTKYIYVKALNGTSQAILTATPSGQTFQAATKPLTINNVAPKIVAPVPTPEDADKYEHITEGFPYSLGVIVNDVEADKDNMVITINWGDGSSPTNIPGTFNASASHTYQQAKDPYFITIRATDGEMPAEQVIVWVAVTDPTRIVINEYKARIPTDIGQNAYKGLQGLRRARW